MKALIAGILASALCLAGSDSAAGAERESQAPAAAKPAQEAKKQRVKRTKKNAPTASPAPLIPADVIEAYREANHSKSREPASPPRIEIQEPAPQASESGRRWERVKEQMTRDDEEVSKLVSSIQSRGEEASKRTADAHKNRMDKLEQQHTTQVDKQAEKAAAFRVSVDEAVKKTLDDQKEAEKEAKKKKEADEEKAQAEQKAAEEKRQAEEKAAAEKAPKKRPAKKQRS